MTRPRAARARAAALAVLGVAAASCASLPAPSPETVAARRAQAAGECGRLLVLTRDTSGRPARDVAVGLLETGSIDYTDARGRLLVRAPCGRHIVWVGNASDMRRDTVDLSYGRVDTLRRTVRITPED